MRNQELFKILKKVQKPAYYIGGEVNSVVKDLQEGMLRYAFCFPDTYEIGMSNLAGKIIYSLLNEQDTIWCERAYAPCEDMERELRKANLPLYSLESYTSLADFDLLGFTLQTELNYTNILNMLELSHIPLLARERTDIFPLIHAGGPCATNPEPLADFFDFFVIGEGEEVQLEFCEVVRKLKRENCTDKGVYLRELAKIEGIYVPSLYAVEYHEETGRLMRFTPTVPEAKPVIKKRIVKDIEHIFYPKQFIVPFCDIVHDRVMVECFRGCIRGCRFCQAGYIYRPIREKSADCIDRCSGDLIASTGYDEISLTSLSTSDYTQLIPLADKLLSWCEEKNISISLPSLRVDNFNAELLDKIQKVRRGGLTFAPEAGTQRMRDIINKNVTEKDLLNTCQIAFNGGYTTIKLYFMAGLPFEQDEDLIGIAALAEKVVHAFYAAEQRNRMKSLKVTISVASFIPKPFTPFQWAAQDLGETIDKKFALIRSSIKSKKISFKYHDRLTGHIEAALARGDRRVGKAILTAFQNGAKFDGWDTHFSYTRWLNAFQENQLDLGDYIHRERPFDELLPWDFIDIGVKKSHFVNEMQKATDAATTPSCREICANCGAACYGIKCD